MKALILIGFQVDFFSLGAAEMAGSEALLSVVNEWLPTFDLVVAARFSHPASHKMFVANYPWRRPGQVIDLMGEKILLKNYHCVEGSFGAELASGFDHNRITHTVFLGTDNRWLPESAFSDQKMARDTGLLAYLRHNHVENIYLAGLPFEETVATTADEAIGLGFSVAIIERAVLPNDPEKLAPVRASLEKKGVLFL